MSGRYRNWKEISSGDRFVLFRAQRADDGHPVVLKVVRQGEGQHRSEELLRHELEILRRLAGLSVARPLGLETLDGKLALVLEDAGPRNLAELAQGRPLATERFLDLAIEMADVLGSVHESGVIHRDPCPAKFVLGERVTLVGFETATAAPAFAQDPGVLGELEGALPYIAPEQTGRTRRFVDYRADLYTLGAAFYEMLTGAPPFRLADPHELVSAHVARQPHAPALINPAVPTQLSNITLKLLSKMPEWRYQSAAALKPDLEEARRQWTARGRIEPFELGRHDVPYGLFLQRRLYGRDAEVRALEQALDRVAHGSAEVLLVTGEAGIGKSALVDEVREAAEGRLRWLAGKGDLLHGNVPHGPIIEAFEPLVRDLLAAPPEQTAPVRERIRRAIAPSGRVLTDAIPGLEALLGEQPPVAEQGPAEAENRFLHAFCALLGALVETGPPIVLFLDDLQWTDPASLKLFQAVATMSALRSFLLLGAYRSEEVGPEHPVARTIGAIRDAGIRPRTLVLAPLDAAAVRALLCDGLKVSPAEAEPLAAIVHQKTAGNPFFVRRLLGFLHRSGALAYSAQHGRWTWDLGAADAAEATENVALLLSRTMHRLPSPEREALSTAACIGNRFSLALLAEIRGEPVDDLARALWSPLREGLLVSAPEDPRFARAGPGPVELKAAPIPTYRFSHDRIQQAAYQLLGEEERKRLHLRIGQHLLAALPADALDAAIGPVVDQLDRAADLIPEADRLRVAELNERAGRQARARAALGAAVEYFRAGMDLLPADAWRTDERDLWFRLLRGAAECSAFSGGYSLCERLIEEGLARTEVLLERAALYSIIVQANAIRGEHEEALRRGRQAALHLGIDLPEAISGEAIRSAKERAEAALGARSDQQLLDAQQMDDPVERARLDLLTEMLPPAWFSDADLFTLLACRAVEMTAGRGLTPASPIAYVGYGVSLALDGRYEEAVRYGSLGVRLAERSRDAGQEAWALMALGGHLLPWRRHLRESVPLLRRAYARGVESGELQSAAYAQASLLFVLLSGGIDLDEVIAQSGAAAALYRRLGHGGGLSYVIPIGQAARCLRGLTRTGCDDVTFDEARFLREAAGNGLGLAVFYLVRLQTSYLLGETAAARGYARIAADWFPAMKTLFLQVDHCYYSSLVLADAHQGAAPEERPGLVTALRANLGRLERWARSSPASFEHKRRLVAAELAAAEGRAGDALALYHSAIEQAGAEGFRQDAAIAHERCARLAGSCGDHCVAALHLQAALDGYARWGAAAKVQALEKEFPAVAASWRRGSVPLGKRGGPPALDYATLRRAAEALSSELVLDRLLEKLTRICIEATSAERAVLLLDEDGLVIRATADATGEAVLGHTPLGEAPAAAPARLLDHVFRSGESVVLGDASRSGRFRTGPYFSGRRVRSLLAVPIGRSERRLGALYLENNLSTDAFSEARVEMLRLLSGEIAVALENSLLFEERRRAESALRLLSDVSAALEESYESEACMRKAVALAVPTLADWCVLDVIDGSRHRTGASAHLDPEKAPLVEALHRRYPIDIDSPQPQARVLRSGKSLLVAEATDDIVRQGARDEEHLRLLEALEPRSFIVVPLIAGGRTLGAASFVRSRPDRRYGSRDLALAEELARRVALGIDNAILHEDLREALRLRTERDRQLALVFHQLPGAVWTTDRDLRLTYITGRPLEQNPLLKVGATMYEIAGTRDPTEELIAHHLAALSGEPQSFETKRRGRWFTMHVEPLRDEQGEIVGCVGAALNVTQLKQSIHDLECALSLLEATINATADGLLVVDQEGKICSYNKQFLSLWHIPDELARQRDDKRLLASVLDQLEEPDSFLCGVHELYHHPARESFDVLRFKDGRVFERYSIPRRIGDKIIGRVWSFRNVTERERLLRRALFLADATRLLASLDVEPALEGVARMGIPYMGDGCAIDLLGNGGPRRLLAVSRDPAQPISPELHGAVLAGHPTIYVVGARSYMAVPLVIKNAVIGAMTFAAAPTRRYTPQDLELAEELARRAALSVENARLYQDAREALQARDEFLAIAVHEIRGPLTSMRLAVQSVLSGKLPPSALPKVLEVIERDQRRLDRFADELLDIGRIRAGQFHFTIEQVDLGDVVREAAARLGAEVARSGSSLSITTEGRPVGQWDAGRLDQVVSNLLSNAIKFGLGKPIEITVVARDGRAVLTVRDHGIGIPPEMHERVFQRYERGVSVRHYGGLGLGLYIVRTIVEGLGGTIRLESQPDVGSTFTIELPQEKPA